MKKVIFMFAAVMTFCVAMTACAKKKSAASTKDAQTTAESQAPAAKNGKILVAYASYTGTTEAVAKMIAQATGGELYKIKPEKEYSSADLDWNDPNSRCCKENDNPKARPAIVKDKDSLDQYELIYLGYPNWWNSHPRLINTFIETYNLTGKKVIPFMTSGGSQIENSEKNLKNDYPEVNWQKGKLLNDVAQSDIDAWVKNQ